MYVRQTIKSNWIIITHYPDVTTALNHYTYYIDTHICPILTFFLLLNIVYGTSYPLNQSLYRLLPHRYMYIHIHISPTTWSIRLFQAVWLLISSIFRLRKVVITQKKILGSSLLNNFNNLFENGVISSSCLSLIT